MQLLNSHRQFLICVSLLYSAGGHAGEVIQSHVSENEGVYTAILVMQINAPSDKVYALLTDYDELSRLSENITDSELTDQNPPTYTVVVKTRNCVLFFCKTLSQTQQALELGKGFIVVEDIKGKSDFIFAETYWHIFAHDKGTRVTFKSEMKPGFWLPPLIGPWIFRNALIDETTKMITRMEKLAVQPGDDE